MNASLLFFHFGKVAVGVGRAPSTQGRPCPRRPMGRRARDTRRSRRRRRASDRRRGGGAVLSPRREEGALERRRGIGSSGAGRRARRWRRREGHRPGARRAPRGGGQGRAWRPQTGLRKVGGLGRTPAERVDRARAEVEEAVGEKERRPRGDPDVSAPDERSPSSTGLRDPAWEGRASRRGSKSSTRVVGESPRSLLWESVFRNGSGGRGR